MNSKMSLPELYAKRDRNNAYVAKLTQLQRALRDKIKADEKLKEQFLNGEFSLDNGTETAQRLRDYIGRFGARCRPGSRIP